MFQGTRIQQPMHVSCNKQCSTSSFSSNSSSSNNRRRLQQPHRHSRTQSSLRFSVPSKAIPLPTCPCCSRCGVEQPQLLLTILTHRTKTILPRNNPLVRSTLTPYIFCRRVMMMIAAGISYFSPSPTICLSVIFRHHFLGSALLREFLSCVVRIVKTRIFSHMQPQLNTNAHTL